MAGPAEKGHPAPLQGAACLRADRGDSLVRLRPGACDAT